LILALTLVRHSEIYNIVGVIDSSLAGKDAGEELGDQKNNIPIFANLDQALGKLAEVPNCYIYGKAPLDAYRTHLGSRRSPIFSASA
jgi:uncharacterized NAD-dependent epimerase/dehydratase family protein